MAKNKRKSVITKAEMKKLFKVHKIGECKVNLFRLTSTNDTQYCQALCRYYAVRDCSVNLERLSDDDIAKFTSKKKILILPTNNTLRSNVSWLPNVSQTNKNSVDALSALVDYQERNCVMPSVAKNKIRQRSKSLFAESTSESIENKNSTIDDFNLEFSRMYGRPNRGLKCNTERVLTPLQPTQISDCQKIQNEFKAKLMAKRLAAAAAAAPPLPPLPPPLSVKLSWDQLKALEPKKYPVVECSVKYKVQTASASSIIIDAVDFIPAHKSMNGKTEQSFMKLFDVVKSILSSKAT